MIDGLHLFKLDDLDHGEIALAVAIPREADPWGVLAPLRETVWGSLIREVSGEAMAHARHGYATPLMREIGPHPQYLARKVSDADGMCALKAECAGFTPKCRPGKALPGCYEAPGLDLEGSRLAAMVALLWREGRYVLVVVGDEFSLS